MAKYVKEFEGDYDQFIDYLKKRILEGSLSVNLEESQKTVINDVTCTVLVYERYSYSGGNRVSMNITILGYHKHIHIIGVSAGGSQATFFKINTFGEESFLKTLIYPVEEYIEKFTKHTKGI